MKYLSQIRIPYVVLLALAALAVSLIGAFFSITGLTKLFSGASLAVMCMAGALEFAKVVAAGFLHQNWEKLGFALRAYLSVAVAVLVCITSMGIYGYLSNAYQKVAWGLKNSLIKEKSIKTEEVQVNAELARLEKVLSDIPGNRVSKRLEVQKELEPQIQNLKKRLFELNVATQHVKMEKEGYQTEVGPMIYVAEAFNIPQDTIAQIFILLFVSVFDPLAICLVFAVSWSLKNQKEEDSLVKADLRVAA